MAIESIVVGVDGSESGFDALAFSVGLAAREQAFVNACYVTHCRVVPTPAGTIVWDTAELGRSLEEEVHDEFKRSDVRGSFVLREGEAATELRKYARECAADLIVVGRSRYPRLHVGSVPRRLLNACDVAILVVP